MLIQLKTIREKRNISQNALAKHLGVSPSYLCRIEKGLQPISISVAIEVADFLDVTLDELVGRKMSKKDKHLKQNLLTAETAE